MKQYPVSSSVTVTIPFVDGNGDPITPTGLSLIVTDENDAVLDTQSPLFDEGDTEASVQVSSVINSIPGLRNLVLTMETANGPIDAAVERFIVAPAVPLVVLQNSFQTYSQAVYEAAQMLPNFAWDNASEQDRINGLTTAYDMLTRFGYRIRRAEDVDTQNRIEDDNHRIPPYFWPVMPLETWQNYPERFRKAMRRAQIVQAAELVSGDLVAKKRRQGLLSETIGESSMMFRSGKPLDMGLSKDVMSWLTGYIDFRITITRS